MRFSVYIISYQSLPDSQHCSIISMAWVAEGEPWPIRSRIFLRYNSLSRSLSHSHAPTKIGKMRQSELGLAVSMNLSMTLTMETDMCWTRGDFLGI